VVGIGTAADAQKDGLIVYKDGTLGLNPSAATPATTTNRLYAVNNQLMYNGAMIGESSQVQKLTQNNKTGYRLLGANAANYGSIGNKAVDLSTSTSASTTKGATGDYAVALGTETTASNNAATAMGQGTTASGYGSTAIGIYSTASGNYAMTLGASNYATGNGAMAIGQQNMASGNNSIAFGMNANASNNSAVAIGQQTTASGSYATATGYSTTASGWATFTAGYDTKATGNISTAIGYSTTASGEGAVALGKNTFARSSGEVAVGAYTTDYTPTSDGNDRAFVVGIGSGSGRDGFTVYKNGSLGLTSSMSAPSITTNRLYDVNGQLMYNGATIGAPSELQKLTQGGNSGYRLLGANVANYGNIGEKAVDLSTSATASTTKGATGKYSVALGSETIASGEGAVATGLATISSGYGSTAMGYYNTASGFGSAAIGYGNTASSNSSIAIGMQTKSSGNASVALGLQSEALETNSIAMGWYAKAANASAIAIGERTTASGNNAIAMGYYTVASGYNAFTAGYASEATGSVSTAFGKSTKATGYAAVAFGNQSLAAGDYSTALGENTIAKSNGELAVGAYNTEYTPSVSGRNPTDRAFVVGIGNYEVRKDGLIVYKDGTIGLNSFSAAPTTTTNRLYVLNSQLMYNGAAIGGSGGSASELQKLSQNSKTGYRFLGANAANYGSIGSNAVDLSISEAASTTKGATGDYAIALGKETTASNEGAVASGVSTIASGYASTALGNATTASGYNSTAIGVSNTASGGASMALGSYTQSTGSSATALGVNTIASGDNSTALGNNTLAKSFGEVAVGSFNTDYTPIDKARFNNGDRAFVVGIGNIGPGGVENRKDGLIVYKNGSVILGGGSVTPKGRVYIPATGSTNNGIYLRYSSASTQIEVVESSQNLSASLVTEGAVLSPAFCAYSDGRIKDVIGVSQPVQDLKTLSQIRITDYTMKDKVQYGSKGFKKVIAQELKTIYPQAVSTTVNFIPNIYKTAAVQDGWVNLQADVAKGDKVRVITASGQQEVMVEAVESNRFKINLPNAERIFFFGKEVNDFHTVDYEALTTLNISATQALLNEIELLKKQNKALEVKVSQVNELKAEVQQIKAILQGDKVSIIKQ
jgi:hypothetical protein